MTTVTIETLATMKKMVKEYERLMNMATGYLNVDPEDAEYRLANVFTAKEDRELTITPQDWVLAVLILEKLEAEGKIDEEMLDDIPGYCRN